MLRSARSPGPALARLCQPATFPTQLRSFSASTQPLAPYQYTTLPERALLHITKQDSPKFLQGLITNDVNRIVNPKGERDSAKVLYAGMLKADVSRDSGIFSNARRRVPNPRDDWCLGEHWVTGWRDATPVPTTTRSHADTPPRDHPQGRILHDIFLFPTAPTTDPPTQAFLIDHPASASTSLRAYLKRHILRTKVSLAREPDPTRRVFAAWRTQDDATEEEVAAAEEWLRSRGVGEDPRAPGMGWRWAGAVEGEGVDLRE